MYSSIEHDYDSTVPCRIEASTEHPRAGTQSMKLTIGAPDRDRRVERRRPLPAAVVVPVAPGDDLYYGMSVYFDTGWEQAIGNQLGGRDYFLGGIGQRYTTTRENGPGANLGIGSSSTGPRFSTGINSTTNKSVSRIDLGPFVTGRWVDFVWHVRWAQDASGVIEAWRDGVKMGAWSGRTVQTAKSGGQHRAPVRRV
jgi:hypothetical protein